MFLLAIPTIDLCLIINIVITAVMICSKIYSTPQYANKRKWPTMLLFI